MCLPLRNCRKDMHECCAAKAPKLFTVWRAFGQIRSLCHWATLSNRPLLLIRTQSELCVRSKIIWRKSYTREYFWHKASAIVRRVHQGCRFYADNPRVGLRSSHKLWLRSLGLPQRADDACTGISPRTIEKAFSPTWKMRLSWSNEHEAVARRGPRV